MVAAESKSSETPPASKKSEETPLDPQAAAQALLKNQQAREALDKAAAAFRQAQLPASDPTQPHSATPSIKRTKSGTKSGMGCCSIL